MPHRTTFAGQWRPDFVVAPLRWALLLYRAGVAGIYNRARYETEKQEALDRWALHLINLPRTPLG